MNEKVTVSLAFVLPLIFLVIMGVSVAKPEYNSQKPQTNFYYVTFDTGSEYAGDVVSALQVVGGKVRFENRNNNDFLSECRSQVLYKDGYPVIAYPDPLPPVCLEKETGVLLQITYDRGLKVYEHDVISNTSRLLSVEEVLRLSSVNTSLVSPEGYRLDTSGYCVNSGDFFFGRSRCESGAYLVSKYRKELMNTRYSQNDYYGTNITFLGWAR